jgi:hypothetical protein
MSSFLNEDEFDALSDPFEGIDWDSVPGMNGEDLKLPGSPAFWQLRRSLIVYHPESTATESTATEPPPTMSTVSSSLDNLTRSVTPPPRPTSSNSSSTYDFGDLDEDILAQVNRIEEIYTAQVAESSALSGVYRTRKLSNSTIDPFIIEAPSSSSDSMNLPDATSPRTAVFVFLLTLIAYLFA